MAVTIADEKHLGSLVHRLPGQAKLQMFPTDVHHSLPGSRNPDCLVSISLFCARTFGIQPEAGFIGHGGSGIFRFNNQK